ncbi:MAG: glycosyltransferase [Xenococcaceae cyanobacterium MO_188.B32]|nr:glycosyltransferase [Xenococcaceae cyanobacterium MO_188.B32]
MNLSTGLCSLQILTLKEAMAMGLPVISTYYGSISELVEEEVSGFLMSRTRCKRDRLLIIKSVGATKCRID